MGSTRALPSAVVHDGKMMCPPHAVALLGQGSQGLDACRGARVLAASQSMVQAGGLRETAPTRTRARRSGSMLQEEHEQRRVWAVDLACGPRTDRNLSFTSWRHRRYSRTRTSGRTQAGRAYWARPMMRRRSGRGTHPRLCHLVGQLAILSANGQIGGKASSAKQGRAWLEESGFSKEDRLNSREFRSTYGLKLQCAFGSRSQSELHAAHEGNSKGGTLASKAAAASYQHLGVVHAA